MAFLGQSFDTNSLPQTSNSYEPLPPGWYTATITNAELRDTKSGTGSYIAVTFDILGPTHQGRKVFGNINIRNANPQAEEIGRQQLGEMMRACGLARVQDTDELIGGTLQIKLNVKSDIQYGDKNEVKGFKAAGHSPAANAYASAASAPTAQPPAGNQPPWAKR